MSEPTHPDILTRLMRFCASPDMFVREEISGGYVRDMIRDARDEIDRLRAAIRRLADQDATLSVCNGNVTVTMDAMLNDAERVAVNWAIATLETDATADAGQNAEAAATLCALLGRIGNHDGREQERVVRLPALDPNGAPGWNAAIGAVREALADAGVDWETE